MKEDEESGEFSLTIDFTPGEGDPARAFKAMSGLVDAMRSLDGHLVSMVSVTLEADLVLDDVESGSIRAKFRDLILGIPDEALKDGDWKKLLGAFLVKAKYVILKWVDGKKAISDRKEVEALEQELVTLAEKTDLKRLPAYAPPDTYAVLSDIAAIQESLSYLEGADTATYTYEMTSIRLNRELTLSDNVVREVLTKEILSSVVKRVLKVKKPDFLGQSMWAFHHDGRAIDAKISDSAWLVRFQARQFDVKPGDALRVELKEDIFYGYEGEVVHREFEVLRVLEVIKPPTQGNLNV